VKALAGEPPGAAGLRLEQSRPRRGRFPLGGGSDPVGPRDACVRSLAEAASGSADSSASTLVLARGRQAPSARVWRISEPGPSLQRPGPRELSAPCQRSMALAGLRVPTLSGAQQQDPHDRAGCRRHWPRSTPARSSSFRHAGAEGGETDVLAQELSIFHVRKFGFGSAHVLVGHGPVRAIRRPCWCCCAVGHRFRAGGS
jgi:hypothetical protein